MVTLASHAALFSSPGLRVLCLASYIWVPFYTETQIRIFNQNRTFRFFTKIWKKNLLLIQMIHNGDGFFGSFLACVQPPLTSKKSIFLRWGAAVQRLDPFQHRILTDPKRVSGINSNTSAVWVAALLNFTAIFDPRRGFNDLFYSLYQGVVKSQCQQDLHRSSLQGQNSVKLLFNFAGASWKTSFFKFISLILQNSSSFGLSKAVIAVS